MNRFITFVLNGGIRKIALFFAVLCTLSALGQKRWSVSGVIKSAATGETLVGVAVMNGKNANQYSLSNQYGVYSITLSEGEQSLVVSYFGYLTDTISVNLTDNKKLNIDMKEASLTIAEVVVTDNSSQKRVSQAQAGVEKISTKEIASIPVIFGEKDIIKTIQLLPGVKSATEGSSGFSVRGGSLDQNLILLDEAPVYNAAHLLGFFSTFNASAIKDVAVYKGNFPAQYGGRVASVVDVTMNNGNNKNYKVEGGIGLISSNLSVEGPIKRDKASFLVTGRRTYADIFLGLSPEFKGNTMYFYDLNAKANWDIDGKNKIYLSGYFGRDVLGMKDVVGMDWGNATGTLRWNTMLSDKLFSNTMLIFSDYSYNIEQNTQGQSAIIRSRIEDIAFKQDFNIYTSGNNTLRFGINSTLHTLKPTRVEEGNFVNPGDRTSRQMWENAAYLSYNGSLTPWFNLEAGVRLSTNTIIGNGAPYNVYDQGILKESITLAKGEFGKTYVNPEPRVSASFTLSDDASLKASYGRNVQYLHMLSNSSVAMPTDQWLGSSYTIKPTICDQYAVGFFRNLAGGDYEFSVEAYYKNLQNEVDFRNGADIITVADIESQLLFGRGRAYGVEFLLRKNSGQFTGWIAYTWSKTERQIDGISNNNWYSTRQDRTHDVSVVGLYRLGKKWELSAVWTYRTGDAITLPAAKYMIDGNVVFYYTERNGARMPAYHRLDVGATLYASPKSSWNFSIYNAYGRENPMMINFEKDDDGAMSTRAVQVSLFRWVPSVTYNFKF